MIRMEKSSRFLKKKRKINDTKITLRMLYPASAAVSTAAVIVSAPLYGSICTLISSNHKSQNQMERSSYAEGIAGR